ncbi:hypothetical protein AQUCO_00300428v1 [Aquilegia coerulea]|uniref:Uncharacterized protein n=1 Tax=Aquilegia coerulea TaxID=218851 RepID=A0A2G5EYV1_AQUCA|nr:hypothetical protein AQUCO_00300428v1 [Aquilegia coerulea]
MDEKQIIVEEGREIPEFVYRISTREEWEEELQKKGFTYGGQLDKTTSSFHLSNLNQVKATLENFFQGREDLYLLQIDTNKEAVSHLFLHCSKVLQLWTELLPTQQDSVAILYSVDSVVDWLIAWPKKTGDPLSCRVWRYLPYAACWVFDH